MSGRTGREETRYLFVELAKGLDEIWCGAQRAFLLAAPGEAPTVVAGRCPHRGGPLALGTFEPLGRRWRCPWHGQKHPLPTLQARGLPAIRRGDAWLVAIRTEDGRDQAFCLTRRGMPPEPSPEQPPA
jgi:nitrite reductase/ring-hydroxylating ferredoxin subunit